MTTEQSEIPLPTLSREGVDNDGAHEHICDKCSKPYNCSIEKRCKMHKNVPECGKCFDKRMAAVSFPGIPDGNGVEFKGPDGTPLPPLSYRMPDPEDMPDYMKKSLQELKDAEHEKEQAKIARRASKQENAKQ